MDEGYERQFQPEQEDAEPTADAPEAQEEDVPQERQEDQGDKWGKEPRRQHDTPDGEYRTPKKVPYWRDEWYHKRGRGYPSRNHGWTDNRWSQDQQKSGKMTYNQWAKDPERKEPWQLSRLHVEGTQRN